jgi:hypothetical protein
MMKCRFFLAILLIGAALVICASAFFESSPVPAAAGTKNLPTALVPNGTSALDGNTGGDWNPDTCHLTPETPGPTALRPPVTPVSDVTQCPASEGDPNQCGEHCIVDITGAPVGERAPEQILHDALLRCNTTIRLGPDVSLDYADKFKDLRPLRFARCVTLTSVNDFTPPISAARTPRSLGPLLHYGDPEESKTFLSVGCDDREDVPPSDRVRISGFRIFGTTDDQQSGEAVGIRVRRCVDVEISNMEIHGFGGQGIEVENLSEDPSPRINDFSQVRIHDNFIHHNQHPSIGGHAGGYGVETGHGGARAHIYRNVFDFNRHAIAASFDTGGYIAEENLVLKGGGWHGRTGGRYTHLFDAHGSGCWWSGDLCGNAGEEFHYYRNSFQYVMDNAISIRGKPSMGAYITENVFPHDTLARCCGLDALINDAIFSNAAILLNTAENVTWSDNITKTDTFGEYYSQCDFDGDGIDDLFLATGTTWWYSSSGKFHWTFLNTSSKRIKDLRFGYFDDDDRCDVLTESGGPGRWVISSGGTGQWKPLEQVWQPQPLEGVWKPLKEVQFGRFDPNDRDHRPGATRRTTHAFHRAENGEWRVKKLSDPASAWEYVGGSSFPLSELRFGDFTGDGVTDVLAVESGHWAISESARWPWRPLNASLKDKVAGLFIANMDPDDNIDDILRREIQVKPASIGWPPSKDLDFEVIWWRSKNGVDRWREFKRYSFKYPSWQPRGVGFVYPGFGFVGRFGAASGGTLTVDEKRIGHFFSPGSAQVAPPEWTSLFPY